MKAYYACEVCGKTYSTEVEALECERKCKKSKLQDAAMKKSNEVLSKLFNQHIREFNTYPEIDVDDDLVEKLEEIMMRDLDSIFNEIGGKK